MIEKRREGTYHNVTETLMHMVAEDCPPVLDKVVRVCVVSGRGGALCLRVELNQPGLQFAGEMQNLNFISEPERGKNLY